MYLQSLPEASNMAEGGASSTGKIRARGVVFLLGPSFGSVILRVQFKVI